MYLCVRGIECLYQASVCICVLGVSSACTRLVSGHMCVRGIECVRGHVSVC